MRKLTQKLMKLAGLEVVTNRDLVLEELAKMPGHDFFVHTGLVFNESVMSNMNGKSYEEWLDGPATMEQIF